jgi:hypothetical protein
MKQIIKNSILSLTVFLIPFVTFVLAREVKVDPTVQTEPEYQPEFIDAPRQPVRELIKKPLKILSKPVTTPEPVWTTFSPKTEVNRSLGDVLADIDAHMTPGHPYREADRIGWGHETTHGIASLLARMYGSDNEGLYVLENRAVILKHPPITMRQVASNIPKSLHGMSYDLYLNFQTRQFNNQPLYIMEEWVCYANGSAVRADLKIQPRSETVQQMLEFMNYSLCVLMTMQQNNVPIDPELKNFVQWHCRRCSQLFDSNGRVRSDPWLRLIGSADAENLRVFCRGLFGEQWTKRILGF